MVHSVLGNVKAADIRHEPYPHLVVRNCLPDAYYQALSRAYPSDELVLRLDAWRRPEVDQNQRHDICAHQALQSRDALSPLWIDFIEYHTSGAFFREAMALLGPTIREIYPSLERRLDGRLEDAVTGIRFDPASDVGQISLDCQVGINTPVTGTSSVQGLHLDSPKELLAMLLYFRAAEDDSAGGDLEIHRWKRPSASLFEGGHFSESDAEYVTTVHYEPNTLVALINSPFALHAVSPRSVTPHSRRLVNIIAEVYRTLPEGLFTRPRFGRPERKGWLKVARSVARRLRRL
jgi:hypothetical protein